MRFDPFSVLSFNFLLAIKERLDGALARPSFKRVERSFHASQHDVQRNSLLLPRFHQRPIHRTEKEMLTASPDERILDFGEVVEVIQSRSVSAADSHR